MIVEALNVVLEGLKQSKAGKGGGEGGEKKKKRKKEKQACYLPKEHIEWISNPDPPTPLLLLP